MGLVSHKVRKKDIKPGDHIYAWRACYTYSHHGIYVGGNKVIHFTAPEDGGSNLSTSSIQSSASYGCLSPCPTSSYGGSNLSTSSSDSSASYGHPLPCPSYPDCGFRQPDSGVVLSCIDCFLGKGSPHLFKYGVTKFSLLVKRPGTCTTAQPDPSVTVIHRATYLLQHGFGDYNIFLNNCEDFAIYCKTGLLDKLGLGRSSQVTSATAAAATAYGLLTSNPVCVAMGAGIYFVARREFDIGLRSGVIKVAVEKLAVFVGPRLPSTRPSLPAKHAVRG